MTNVEKHKKLAFTLAEVLITLGIIGVVAAMTMPSLISNYQQKQYEAKYAKAQNVMANGIKMMMAQNNIYDVAELPIMSCSDDTCRNAELSKVFKSYSVVTDRSKLPEKYKNDPSLVKVIENADQDLLSRLNFDENIVKAATFNWSTDPDFVFRLEDSMLIGIKKNKMSKDVLGIMDTTMKKYPNRSDSMAEEMSARSGISTQKISSGNKINRADDDIGAGIDCLQVFVDINGSTAPNTVGKDMYEFVLSDKGKTTELSSYLNPTLGALVNRLQFSSSTMN